MDRYDITIQMLGVEASGPQYVWEKVPAEEGELVLYTDAQAAIAALQARVQELEGWQNGVVKAFKEAPLEWSPHLAPHNIPDVLPQIFKNMHDYATRLTQRTAELEAAKQHHEQSENAAQLYYRELTRVKNRICEAAGLPLDSGYEPAIKHLQAELERVRGELGETKLYLQQERANRDSLVACVSRDVKTIKELRALILALPKVEGDVEVYHHESGLRHSVVARPANKYYSSFDTPEEAGAYAAILKHRQGMEG